MIKSDRSKRRKIRKELCSLSSRYSTFPNICNNLDDNVEFHVDPRATLINKNQDPPTSVMCPRLNVSNNISPSPTEASFNLSSSMNIDVDPVSLHDELTLSNICMHPSSETLPVEDQIAHWAIQFNIPHNAVNSLLKCLNTHKCFNHFPSDCRTLLATPSNTSTVIRHVNPGIYHHFGLESGLKQFELFNLKKIEIAIGIDGLPLSKSSGAQFWPILAYIMNIPKKTVFLVGLYYGNEKPLDSNIFLSDFVDEACYLSHNGVILNNMKIDVSIQLFSCDAPAKSYVLKVKGHSGFFSCTRCVIEGEYVNNRVAFPYSEIKSKERTHDAYHQMLDDDFHISNEISILTKIDGFDSVKMFCLDYMHLVCLGVMKKLMLLWFSKGPLTVRVRSRKTNELSAVILSLNKHITSDFARKLRSIHEMRRWKATEFRLFLLYVGPIILKNSIKDECYNNFLALNIAMLILLSPDYSYLLDYARQLLNYFVKSFQKIYGIHNVSHNVHNLLHLCDDYEAYGPLDNYSAFIFENYMKELKSFLRKSEKPLQQVINRYTEQLKNNKKLNVHLSELDISAKQPILKNSHTNGPINENIFGIQYYTIIFKNTKLSTKQEKDSYFLTKTGQIIKCLNFIQNDNGDITVLGKHFKESTPLFYEPINSSILNIFVVKNLSKQIHSWSICEMNKKMMIFQFDRLIAMPIIHTAQN